MQTLWTVRTGVAVAVMALAGCGGGGDSSESNSGSSSTETQQVSASSTEESKVFVDGDQVTVSDEVDAKPSDVTIGKDNIRAAGELARKLHLCLVSDPALQEVDVEIADQSYGSGVEGSDAKAWTKYEYASPNTSEYDQDVYVGYGVTEPSVTVGRWASSWQDAIDEDGGSDSGAGEDQMAAYPGSPTNYTGDQLTVLYDDLAYGEAAQSDRMKRCTPQGEWTHQLPAPGAYVEDEASPVSDADGSGE